MSRHVPAAHRGRFRCTSFAALFVLISGLACSTRSREDRAPAPTELGSACEQYLSATETCLSSLAPNAASVARLRADQARDALRAEVQRVGAETVRRTCVDNLARLKLSCR